LKRTAHGGRPPSQSLVPRLFSQILKEGHRVLEESTKAQHGRGMSRSTSQRSSDRAVTHKWRER